MRERIEDIGILAEKLDNICDSEVFEAIKMHDEKFLSIYSDLEKLDELYYQLKTVYDQLCDCYFLARWGDQDED